MVTTEAPIRISYYKNLVLEAQLIDRAPAATLGATCVHSEATLFPSCSLSIHKLGLLGSQIRFFPSVTFAQGLSTGLAKAV